QKPSAPGTAPVGLHAFGPNTINLAGAAAATGALDLDLDFSLDDAPAAKAPASAPDSMPNAPMSDIDDLEATAELTAPSREGPPSLFDLELPDPSPIAERAETAPVALEVPHVDRGAPDSVAAPSL